MDRLGLAADVGQGPVPGHYRVTRRLDPATRVSVVIPTIGQSALIWGSRRVMVVEAVRSLLARTAHENLEIVVVYDEPTPTKVLRAARGGRRRQARPASASREPFNYSEKMNVGCLRASGERLVFLNDDVEVISDGWLEQLVAPLDEPDVGMTGARLYFSDDTVQHAGHAYGRGHYLHPYRDLPRESYGPFGALIINREASGVTAACAAMRRDTFVQVGGFCEALPANFNDVDLCYKVRRHGQRIVYVARRRALPLRVEVTGAGGARLGARPRAWPVGHPAGGRLRAEPSTAGRHTPRACLTSYDRLSCPRASRRSPDP